MGSDSLQEIVAGLVKRAGSVAELARLSLVSERSIRNYLSGSVVPNGKVLERLRQGAAEVEKRRGMLGGQVQHVAEPASVYVGEPGGRALELKRLASAIFEVESRVPMLGPDVKAALIAACYERMNSAAPGGAAAVKDFIDLITGAAAAGRTLPIPRSDEEEREDARSKQGRK